MDEACFIHLWSWLIFAAVHFGTG